MPDFRSLSQLRVETQVTRQGAGHPRLLNGDEAGMPAVRPGCGGPDGHAPVWLPGLTIAPRSVSRPAVLQCVIRDSQTNRIWTHQMADACRLLGGLSAVEQCHGSKGVDGVGDEVSAG